MAKCGTLENVNASSTLRFEPGGQSVHPPKTIDSRVAVHPIDVFVDLLD
jgi:hypothetical protein